MYGFRPGSSRGQSHPPSKPEQTKSSSSNSNEQTRNNTIMIELTFNKPRNTLLNISSTSRIAISTDATNLFEQNPSALDGILLVAESGKTGLVLEQIRPFQETSYLTKEGDGLLIELLRIANVGKDDGVEGEVLSLAFFELGLVLRCALGNETTHSVLGCFDVRVDVVERERLRHLG